MKISRCAAVLAAVAALFAAGDDVRAGAGRAPQAGVQSSQPAPEPASRPADPGVNFVTIMERPEVRILRVVVEPGAVRRVHTHNDVTFHLLMTLNGPLQVTMDKEQVEARPGQAFFMKVGTPHTFRNDSPAAVTVMEVFVKPAPAAADGHRPAAPPIGLARALATLELLR